MPKKIVPFLTHEALAGWPDSPSYKPLGDATMSTSGNANQPEEGSEQLDCLMGTYVDLDEGSGC